MPRKHNIKPHSSLSGNADPTIATGEYIADVFLLWDCLQNTWFDNSPILLRLENFDLIVEWPDRHETPVFDTGRMDQAYDASKYAGDDEVCLIWQRHPEACCLVGEKVSSIKINNQSIWVHADNGQDLKL